MRSLLGVVILGAPALALAQPGPDPAPPPPPGTYQPATGNPPYSAPPPAQPGPYNPNNGTQPYTPPPPSGPQPGQYPPPQQPYYPPQQPYYPPQQPQQGPYGQQPYGYQPYQQPYQQPPPPRNLRDGMTFEINLGIGWLQADDEYTSDTSDAGLGFGLGVGGWLNKNMAVTGRLASTTVTVGDDGYGNDITMHGMFLGPSLQYWVDEGLFIRGGIGVAIAGVSSEYSDESDSINGFGLDLGIGYNFSRGSENTFNASLELTPGFYSEGGESATLGGISILVGYQHL